MKELSLVEEQLDEEELPQIVILNPPTDAEIEDRYANSSFRVLYQSNNFFLPQIYSLIEDNEILNLRPEYQRRLRWGNKQKSLLIESLLLNVPIPPVFLFESELARYEVMDGQQRLSTVHEFLKNEFALVGLEKLTFLERKRYTDLPPKLKRGLDRSSISATVLLHETQANQNDVTLVRRYVFQRLNTGGTALNAQEIRNSLYRSSFNNLVISLAREDKFCDAFGIPRYAENDYAENYENPERKKNALYKKMEDCALVLRFFAFVDDANIRGSVKSMLDATMERHLKDDDAAIDASRIRFVKSLTTANAIFDEEAFTLPPNAKGERRVSAALYDAVMVALDRKNIFADEYIKARARIVADVDQLSAVNPALMTGKANTAESIKQRILEIVQILENIAK